MLNEIDFEWSRPFNGKEKERGHCRVPGARDSETYQLAQWIAHQRRQYKLLQQGKK
jgi:hypothetical protein